MDFGSPLKNILERKNDIEEFIEQFDGAAISLMDFAHPATEIEDAPNLSKLAKMYVIAEDNFMDELTSVIELG